MRLLTPMIKQVFAKQINRFDKFFIDFSTKFGVPFLRFSIGIVFIGLVF